MTETKATSKLIDYLPEVFQSDPFVAQILLAFETILFGYNENSFVFSDVSVEDLDSRLHHLKALFNEDQLNVLLKRDNPNENPLQKAELVAELVLLLNSIQGLEPTIANIWRFFDPHLTPPDFLPWLASWLAFLLRNDIIRDDVPQQEKFQKQREFIANMSELYRWRGTKKNMIKLFEIFTGHAPTVSEPFDDNHPHFFTVLLNLSDVIRGKDQAEVDRQIEIAHALIRLEKPAHTHYQLLLQFPTFRIGSENPQTDFFTVVGVNTRLGSAQWDA
jgi:phage tail-like protein